ncbi:peptide deformylase [Polychytrium aggregatum]|uniref:peptide deformylase n=1 Tax=Polychytrium aggregatum TaxID=110093 RepID=UPI0022FDCA23|nr:peptide deformylase [Polychytrium aggregatum]KAI9205496.1 peptide deformylase [Polychytrium aggregatum]
MPSILQTVRYALKRPPTVLRAGHPLLRLKADPVSPAELTTPKFKKIVSQMKEVFSSPYTPVIGLSAPQIGHSVRLIAVQVTDSKTLKEKNMKPFPLTFMVNPEVTIVDTDARNWVSDYESCESVPSYNALVKRAESVKVKSLDLDGKEVSNEFHGLLARIVQHEVDHLDGKLYIDCMDHGSLRHDKYIDQFEIHTRTKPKRK